MFDYRLFYPQASLDLERVRRPHQGHAALRVNRLPADRRVARQAGRR